MTDNGIIIRATALRKRYGSTLALNNIDLEIAGGETLCVIGPNGAGKTTLLMLLGGVLLANGGSVTVFGLDRWRENYAIRKRSTCLSADPIFGTCATPYEYLRFIGQIYGLPKSVFLERAKRLADEMDMTPHLNKFWGKLSLGMQKKAGLMASFLPDAELRILDEPFAGGIDPMGMERLYHWFGEANTRGETVLFSTQVLEQAETAAHRLLMLGEGSILALGTPTELMQQAGVDPNAPRPLPTAFKILAGRE
jgi:ABC-type multidrug transport system ATPase subunit